jgi:hypothetical protein
VAKVTEGRSDANLDFDDLCFVLEPADFARRAGKGSDTIFCRDDVARMPNLQANGPSGLRFSFISASCREGGF